MKKTNKHIIVITLLLSINISFAGEILTGNPERKRTSNEAMNEATYKKFVKLQEMMADSRYIEARAGLEALTAKRLNGFEKANVNQYLGYVDSAEGKYVSAAKRFQIAIDSEALPNQAHFSMMLQIAQMYLAGGKYQLGLNALRAYYNVTDKITDTTFAQEANAYAQLNQFSKAIPVLKKAIKLSGKPKESWNYLLYSMHMELSQFYEASKVLETLIKINPNKKDYWKRLSSVYFNLKKDDKALAVLVLADKNGLLKEEKERLQLFKMYTFLDIPFSAGKILQKGLDSGLIKSSFKHWEDLGKTWYSAAEMDKALSAYNRASKLASDGKIDYQRAFIFFEREDWDNTKQALKSAIEKGGLEESKVGQAWLLMGMVESEMNNRSGAIAALKNASKYSNTKNNAIQWLDHLTEEARKARIKAEQERILAEEEKKIASEH